MPGRAYVKNNGDGTASISNGLSLAGGAAVSERDMKKDSGLLAIGLNGVYGAPTTINPITGFNTLDIENISYVMGGTFAGGPENVTVKITVTYNDNTTADYIPAAFTATGTTVKTESDYDSLIVEGKSIKRVQVFAKTDQVASTLATAKVILEGEYVV